MDSLIELRLPLAPPRRIGGVRPLGRGITASIALHVLAIIVALSVVREGRAPTPPKDKVLELVLAAPPKPALPAPAPITEPAPEPAQSAPPPLLPPPPPSEAPAIAPPPPVTAAATPPPPAPSEPAKPPPPPVAPPALVPRPQAAVAVPQAVPTPPRKSTPRPPRPSPPEPRAVTAEPAAPAPAVPSPSSAPAAPAAPPAAPAQASPAWLSSVSDWLLSHRSYPELARRRSQEGTVVLRFTVDRDGRVQDVTLVRSSGSEALDQAAQTLLANAHLPPFPPDMALPRQTLTVPIRYRLE